MSERIAWTEPAEATAQRGHLVSQAHRDSACQSMLVGVGAVFVALAAAPAAAFTVGLAMAGIIGVCSLPLATASLTGAKAGQGEVQYVLDRERVATQIGASGGVFEQAPWDVASSFEITDHPTLPGLRRLTIRTTREAPLSSTHLDFRPTQVDEADLRAFVGARIAERTAQRLMRRVQM